MLYKESKEYLLDKLKAAGLKSKPYTTQKALEKVKRVTSARCFLSRRPSSETAPKHDIETKRERRKKRRKVFDRALAFTVIIGDYTDEAVESMFGAFLSSLDRGHLRQRGTLFRSRSRGRTGSTRTTLF